METIEIRSLFDELTEIDIGLTPQERFEKFHSENMHVYVELRNWPWTSLIVDTSTSESR